LHPLLLPRPSPLVAPSRDAALCWKRPPSPVATLLSGRRTIAQRGERPASPSKTVVRIVFSGQLRPENIAEPSLRNRRKSNSVTTFRDLRRRAHDVLSGQNRPDNTDLGISHPLAVDLVAPPAACYLAGIIGFPTPEKLPKIVAMRPLAPVNYRLIQSAISNRTGQITRRQGRDNNRRINSSARERGKHDGACNSRSPSPSALSSRSEPAFRHSLIEDWRLLWRRSSS